MTAPLTYDALTDRSVGVVSAEEQEKLRNSTVAIAGLGAGGGTTAMLLARCGVGRLRGTDPDVFEATNVNRQVFATASTLGKSKAEVTKAGLLEINPELDADFRSERLLTVEDSREFLAGADHAIIAADNRAVFLPIATAAQQLGIPATVMSIAGFRCFATTLDGPDALDTLRWFLGVGEDDSPERIAELAEQEKRRFMADSGGFTDQFAADFPAGRTMMKAFAPMAFLAASLASVETVKWLIGRGERLIAPKLVSLDALAGKPWDALAKLDARES